MSSNRSILGVFNLSSEDRPYRVEIRDIDGIDYGQFKKINDAWIAAGGVIETNSKHFKSRRVRIKQLYQDWILINSKDIESATIKVPERFTVEQRFHFMRSMIEIVLDSDCSGTIICGAPGIGKTYNVVDIINHRGLTEGVDYYKINGAVSPLGLYTTLYRHSDKVIIFDDSDMALLNPACVNLLKAALDTCDKRIIHWHSLTVARDQELVEEFEFTGKVIFISNFSQERIDSAIVSRSMCLDLRLSRGDIVDRIVELAPEICKGMDSKAIDEIIKFIRTHVNQIHELNLRTLIKISKIYESGLKDWKNMAEYLFLN